MITALFKLIFKIVGFLANIILTPLFSLVSTLIPSTSEYIDKIDYFFNYGIQYVGFAGKFLMIPSSLFKVFFGFAGSLLVGFGWGRNKNDGEKNKEKRNTKKKKKYV